MLNNWKTFSDNNPLQASNESLLIILGSLEKALSPITLLAPLIFKSKTGAQLKFF